MTDKVTLDDVLFSNGILQSVTSLLRGQGLDEEEIVRLLNDKEIDIVGRVAMSMWEVTAECLQLQESETNKLVKQDLQRMDRQTIINGVTELYKFTEQKFGKERAAKEALKYAAEKSGIATLEVLDLSQTDLDSILKKIIDILSPEAKD
jgi:hypothetical protein